MTVGGGNPVAKHLKTAKPPSELVFSVSSTGISSLKTVGCSSYGPRVSGRGLYSVSGATQTVLQPATQHFVSPRQSASE